MTHILPYILRYYYQYLIKVSNSYHNYMQTMESCIKQNNAIEIYQDYFNEIDEATDCEEPKAKVT